MAWWWPTQLDRIEKKLDQVLQQGRKIMASEQELDDAIAGLAAAQEEEGAAIQSIIDKLEGVTSVDLTDEIASLEAIKGRAQEATDAIKAAVNPEPTPEPAP
jgi:chromosome segregation ATPase